MIIQCTNCHARYQYDEDRFERKPSKKIKCAKCSTIFEIQNPAITAQGPADSSPPKGDLTFAKRDQQKPPPDETDEAPVPKILPNSPQLPQGKRLSLAVINGADAGSVYRVEKPRIIVGRSGADLNLNDTEASRHHAVVEIRDLVYILEDLGSTNGTLVDGAKISGRVEMQNHSEFQIGSTTIMLIVTEDV